MTPTTLNFEFPFPEKASSVLTSGDFQKLATSVDSLLFGFSGRIDDAKFDYSSVPLGASSNLDTLGNGIRSVWSGGVAEALGLPNVTLGTVITTRYGTGAGMQMWIPRLGEGAQVWVRNELTEAWTPWTQIGAGGGLRALRPAAPGGLKTAPLALTLGYGGAQTSGSGTTVVIQHMPVTTKRVQLHLVNRNPRYAMADSAAVAVSAVAIGLHNGSGGSSAWTSFPASSGSTGYTSGWIEVPEAWRGKDIAVRYTWSGSTVQRNMGTGWTNGTRDNVPPLFAWLEVEVPASTPVVAAFGDSLSSGTSSSRPVVDSWIDQWARANGAVPAHWSHSGDKASGWPGTAGRKWFMYGENIAAPDSMVYMMGSNDLSENAPTIEDMTARILANVVLIRGQITPNVYAGTLLPRTGQPSSSPFETVRRQVNLWMPQSGLFRDVFGFAAAVSSDDDNIDPAIDADGTHLTTAGYKRIADAVSRSVVAISEGAAAYAAYVATRGS